MIKCTGYGTVTACTFVVLFFHRPIIIGKLENWLVPPLIGAPDVAALPQINNVSVWCLPPSFLPLLVSWGCEARAGTGSAGDPLLVGNQAHVAVSVDLFFLLHLSSGYAVLGAINFFFTPIIAIKPPVRSQYQTPLFVRDVLISAFLALLSVPALAGGETETRSQDRTQSRGSCPCSFYWPQRELPQVSLVFSSWHPT